MASGLFDRHPRLQIILGHLGEGLPFSIWRCDHRNAWTKAPPRYPAKEKLGYYFQRNFYLTTSGNFHTPSLVCSMLEIGADRIMFSTDWPFENVDHAAIWFDACAISEADRQKIGRDNARRLFKLA
jgi:2,3-dihydroxybenzoate decarboxylase